MSKNWELVGRDVLVTKRTGMGGDDKSIAFHLSSVTRWQEYLGDLSRTNVWFNDGGEAVIAIPFDEFTRIIARPTIITASD